MEYKSFTKKLSLREQALLLTGADFWHTNPINRLGIPQIMVSDGPTGLRKEEKLGKFGRTTIKSVCFPSATALAASWDRGLLTQLGYALADECKAKRVSVLLGPGINIKRSPLCGRNFEYYSEDPVLAGELAASYINAVQEKGIGTSLKHFAANSTESKRMASNSLVDERALREIYLRGFEIAVRKAQPWTVMCAYNKLRGAYCSENAYLITDILRDEWGFKGLTVSDWMAVNNRVDSLIAGLDLEMPSSGYLNVRALAKAYRNGVISADTIATSAGRVLELVEKAEPVLKEFAPQISLEDHHKFAGQIAEQCAVLLKNEGNVLPISPDKKIAVIGERAKKPLYQGCGSAQINSYRVENVMDALSVTCTDIRYARGYNLEAPDEINSDLINEACDVASRCNVALVFVSCSELDVSESADRSTISLPLPQTELINAVCRVNPNVAVIVTTGSNVEMPWVDAPKAIMQAYLLGEASGTALANILTGKVSPSGKLPESYPVALTDTACLGDYQTRADNNVIYRESIFVGYRYYEKTGTPVLFPFGHGLSYTTFDYSGLRLSADEITPEDTLKVSFTIKNTGSVNAAEIAQIYVGKSESLVYRANKELKEFAKVLIPAGGSKDITVELPRSAFEYYSVKLGRFVVEGGTYDIYVGSSSADIRLTGKVVIDSTEDLGEIDYMDLTPSYFCGDIKNVSDDEFETVLGDYIDDYVSHKTDDRITINNTLMEAEDTFRGKSVIDFLDMVIDRIFKDNVAMKQIVRESVLNIPLKRFVATTHGAVSVEMVESLANYINGGTVGESVKIAAFGLPGTLLDILSPVVRSVVEKKARS